ncbi:MAG: PhoH family protein [Nitrososphaeraceae archaeon]
MSRKRTMKASKKNNVYELSEALHNNGRAILEGPKRKSWSKHDLRTIRPLTPTQDDMFHAYINNYNICAYGSAGSGKTLCGLYLALTELFDEKNETDHIIIVRSTVPTREIGHLPGTLAEKISPYEAPYHDIFHYLIGKSSSYEDMKEAGLVKFESTSFIRGLTWDNAIVVIDECQSMSWHEINSVVTRLGDTSKLIVLGDTKQNDLIYKKNDVSGFVTALQVFESMPEMAMVKFLSSDIVRGPFVKSWLTACEDLSL